MSYDILDVEFDRDSYSLPNLNPYGREGIMQNGRTVEIGELQVRSSLKEGEVFPFHDVQIGYEFINRSNGSEEWITRNPKVLSEKDDTCRKISYISSTLGILPGLYADMEITNDPNRDDNSCRDAIYESNNREKSEPEKTQETKKNEARKWSGKIGGSAETDFNGKTTFEGHINATSPDGSTTVKGEVKQDTNGTTSGRISVEIDLL